MQAFQLLAHGRPGQYELRPVADPQPEPDEVVVAVEACGLNHLDLWLEKGELPVAVDLPRTPGGEVAGRVLHTGKAVQGWKVGDRVAVQSNLFCGHCEFCQQGQESRCLNSQMLGVQRDGGFAEQVVVPARVLVALPAQVDCQSSAALSLAGSTAMHMLTNRTQVTAGSWVLVVAGASGVGVAAIQIARNLGGRVISTGSTATKRALAQRLGAEHVLDSNQADWPGEVRRLTGKRGVELVVEHVGGPVLEQLFQCLARGGTVVTCGATAGRKIPFDLWPFFVKEHRLIGSYSRDRSDLIQTLQWAADGRLKPVIDATFPLAQAGQALERLRTRQAVGKLLVTNA
jgi:2-desacetyl-2-hydroxyethyl bacteriochlorophyllide A dehydrogenase